MCNANAAAHPSVSTSPLPTLSTPPVSSHSPTVVTTTATTTRGAGSSRCCTAANTGTSTTSRYVMNADVDVSVYCSPTVCSTYPTSNAKPVSTAGRTTPAGIGARRRAQRKQRDAADAEARRDRNAVGLAASTESRMMTNVEPNSSAAARTASAARRSSARGSQPEKRLVIGTRRSRPNALSVMRGPSGVCRRLYSERSTSEMMRRTTASSNPSAMIDVAERVVLDVDLEDRVEDLVGRQALVVALVGAQLRRRCLVEHRGRDEVGAGALVAATGQRRTRATWAVPDDGETAGGVAVQRRVADAPTRSCCRR